MMRSIAHIIHPVVVDSSSDLHLAQPITLHTMEAARTFAIGKVDVRLYYTRYDDEDPDVPEDFSKAADLDRSVRDVAQFEEHRKLAILGDILDRLYEATDAEYLFYTNVDIALLPHFYLAADCLIEQGYDAFTINRRTIDTELTATSDIPLMCAQLGEGHQGHDCFVFRRSAYPSFRLGNLCVGTGRVGAGLIVNLIYSAERFDVFSNLHLTFHLGNEKAWKSGRFSDYFEHNERELLAILRHYDVLADPRDHRVLRQELRRYQRQLSGRKTGSMAALIRKAKHISET